MSRCKGINLIRRVFTPTHRSRAPEIGSGPKWPICFEQRRQLSPRLTKKKREDDSLHHLALFVAAIFHCHDDRKWKFAGQGKGKDSHLQTAAIVDGSLQSYPGNKNPIVPVDAIAFAYVETEGLSRSFDYLDKVDRVFRILKQRSRTNIFLIRNIFLIPNISQCLRVLEQCRNYTAQNCSIVVKIIFPVLWQMIAMQANTVIPVCLVSEVKFTANIISTIYLIVTLGVFCFNYY